MKIIELKETITASNDRDAEALRLRLREAGTLLINLMSSPGSGKTMLARSLPSILPELTVEEALEITRIHSVAGQLRDNSGVVTERPFRAPHHSASIPALVGGGAKALETASVSPAARG